MNVPWVTPQLYLDNLGDCLIVSSGKVLHCLNRATNFIHVNRLFKWNMNAKGREDLHFTFAAHIGE